MNEKIKSLYEDERLAENYQLLCTAIVEKAIQDWKDKMQKEASDQSFDSLRRFFKGDVCAFYLMKQQMSGEYILENLESIRKKYNKKVNGSIYYLDKNREVIELFPSRDDASEATGISVRDIKISGGNKGRIIKPENVRFMYLDDYKEWKKEAEKKGGEKNE